MKHFTQTLTALVLFSLSTPAQSSDFDPVFEDAFSGMFDTKAYGDISLDTSVMDNPPPPVPLDGGLVALLGAGAAVGYRKFRQRRRG
jgi:MYXO-CTERM domain-containing protein